MVQKAGAPQPPQTLGGKVLRPFYYQGKVLEKGKSYELPRVFALEMKAANKFEISNEPDPVSAGPASTEPGEPERRPDPKPAKAEGKKGAKDAG